MSARPVIWSVAATDSGGGAGLSADQRAAEAFGVHLCPVVAAVTAQNSQAIAQVEPVSPAMLDAQLRTLAQDLPPRVIKTGVLASASHVRVLVDWVDRLRQQAPVDLVVDPVLAATTGHHFADAALLQAYQELLLPRTTLLTPNRREAGRLLGQDATATTATSALPVALPALARALRATGCGAVAITGGDSPDAGGSATQSGEVVDWIDTPQAAGWLAAPRIHTPHHHGSGCTFASSAASALALGFGPADALVLAKMATLHALAQGQAAGQGAGPVHARSDFGRQARWFPRLSWGEALVFAPSPQATPSEAPSAEPIGLYGIVDSASGLQRALAAGLRTLQLRIKSPERPDPSHAAALQADVADSIARCQQQPAAHLYINDHLPLATQLGAHGVHLGQEDLLALGEAGRAALRASGLALGISSHSLWELARARSLAPAYIACGPVWPTLTKAMPWRPQGLDNLAWWCAMAGCPVVAIGGILGPEQVEAAAASGADGVCVVRALGEQPAQVLPRFQAAWQRGRARWLQGQAAAQQPTPTLAARGPALPHPSLDRQATFVAATSAACDVA